MRHDKFLVAIFVAMTAAFGCKVSEMDDNPDSKRAKAAEIKYPVHFVADEIPTKTVFGDAETVDGKTQYPTLWTANDSKVAVSLNEKSPKGATVIPSADFTTATFDADFSNLEVEEPYVFYALSPFSASVGYSSSRGGYHFEIPANQTPLATSCDEAAQVLIASKEVASIDEFTEVRMHFSHVTAYGKLTLKNMTVPEGATLQSIELTASEHLVGRFYYKFDAPETLEESSASRTVTLKPDNITVDASGNAADIWFACAPADLGGGKIKVTVNFSTGFLSRTVEIPSGKLAFNAGRVSKFAVNMAGIDFTPMADRWVLVTDASTLKAGDEIIIANSATVGSGLAISTTQNTGNTPSRGSTLVTIDRDTDGSMIIQNPSASVEILSLLTGYRLGTFYFKEATSNTENYLYASNTGGTNSLNSAAASTATNSTYRDYASWVITISDKIATISTYGRVSRQGSNYYRHIRLNGSTFGTYRSSSQTSWNSTTTGTTEVYIYRKENGVNIEEDPILEETVFGAYLSGGNTLYEAGAQQLSREYHGDGTLTFAILTYATNKIAEFNNIPVDPAKGDTFTLNYNLISGRSQSDTDYEVTVVRVEGAKVWLSAGSGKGFIVKK